MEIDVPPEYKFDCPEGYHAATFYDHKEISKPNAKGVAQAFIRLRFKIDKLSNESRTMLVCKNYAPTLKVTGELRCMLNGWLGKDFIEEHTVKRKFDFNSLNDLKARVLVGHIHNDSHREPYVCLQAVYPPEPIAPEPPEHLEYD